MAIGMPTILRVRISRGDGSRRSSTTAISPVSPSRSGVGESSCAMKPGPGGGTRTRPDGPPPAHELEQDDEQAPRGDDCDDLYACLHQIPWVAATGASSPGSTTGLARASPTKIANSTLIM